MYRLVGASLFAAGALICYGFAIALTYEALSVATGRWPMISGIVSSQVLGHPVWTGALMFVSGIILGGLAVHFSGWRP